MKSDAGYVDLGLHGRRATSDNVATVFRRQHSRKDLGDLPEAKFKASLLAAAVYLEAD